ncbi:MAG: hypothetical protein HC906_18640, partial [Bacteroidales bacterium]|nr:hypothetical protein [Bacteroidales bacterium]
MEICKGSNVTLRTEKCQNSRYQWLKDGCIIQDAINDSLVVSKPGNYRVVVMKYPDELNISDACVVKENDLSVYFNRNDTTVFPATLLRLNPVVHYSGENELTYLWSIDTEISKNSFLELSPTESKIIKLFVTDSVCKDSANYHIFVSLPVVIDDRVYSKTFIYPNPTYDKLYIKNFQRVTIAVYDLQGKLLI